MGVLGFLMGVSTLPLALWTLADAGVSAYKFSFRQSTIGQYGSSELVVMLVFSMLKIPVALFCVWLWAKVFKVPVDDEDPNGAPTTAEDRWINRLDKWSEADEVMKIPKALNSMFDSALLVCNVRILASMRAAKLFDDYVDIAPTSYFNSYVVALYTSVIIEIAVTLAPTFGSFVWALFSCACSELALHLFDSAFLCIAFCALRASYDLQSSHTGGLYGFAIFVFFFGVFLTVMRDFVYRVASMVASLDGAHNPTSETKKFGALVCWAVLAMLCLFLNLILCSVALGESVEADVFYAGMITGLTLSVILLCAFIPIVCIQFFHEATRTGYLWS